MFATYAELTDHVADWLHRPDLTVRIPEFVAMGENWLNRKLRIWPMLTNETATLYANAATVSYPASAAWIQDVYLDGEKLSLGSGLNPDPDDKGEPQEWEPQTSFLLVDRYADQTYTLDLRYAQKFNIAADSINWLLRNAPEAYLYASLMHANQYVIDDQRLATAAGQAQAIVAELNSTYAIPATDLLRTEV